MKTEIRKERRKHGGVQRQKVRKETHKERDGEEEKEKKMKEEGRRQYIK